MGAFERGPLRIEGAPSLGESLFHVSEPTAAPVALVDMAPVIAELRSIRTEVQALRRDLADRSAESRLRRVWAWVRWFFGAR